MKVPLRGSHFEGRKKIVPSSHLLVGPYPKSNEKDSKKLVVNNQDFFKKWGGKKKKSFVVFFVCLFLVGHLLATMLTDLPLCYWNGEKKIVGNDS